MNNGRILLLDNRDSFVWNLAQAFRMLDAAVDVVRSDRIDVPGIEKDMPRAVVLSPGPGRPEDAGACLDVVRALHPRLPILGVCLGHQALAAAFGAEIRREPPCHGKTSAVNHGGAGLFDGVPSPFAACRYHSLAVARDTVPEELVAEAWTDSGAIMSLRHRTHPSFGLQFHPESFRTEHGMRLLRNFMEHA